MALHGPSRPCTLEPRAWACTATLGSGTLALHVRRSCADRWAPCCCAADAGGAGSGQGSGGGRGRGQSPRQGSPPCQGCAGANGEGAHACWPAGWACIPQQPARFACPWRVCAVVAAQPEPKKQLPKPTVVLKPRSAAPPSAPSTTAPKASSSQQQPIAAGSSAGPEADARSAKRAKLEEGQGLGGSAGGGSGQGGEEGLAGLLGSYGSDSDDS